METTMSRKHIYPRADPQKEPTPWWYFGRAVYVSRYDYKKIFFIFLAVGIPIGAIGVLFKLPIMLYVAFAIAGIGVVMLIYSLIGLYRQYGHSSVQYFQRLLDLADAKGPLTVADLHIGTYRHSYRLAELLPEATIYSVDCWNIEGPPPEKAIRDVRDLEPPPTSNPHIQPLRAEDFTVPLPDSSCDLVVFGFGTHEVPVGGPREKLFNEAKRVLRPGGKALLFEHGYDFHNFIIFGPVIEHVTKRADWLRTMQANFDDVRYARTSHAVDLFVGTHA